MTDDKEEQSQTEILARVERLLERMQKIQRGIRTSGEPLSQIEVEKLKVLGEEYGELVSRLEVEIH